MKYIILFSLFIFSCKETAPVIVRDYAPAQFVVNDTTTQPVIITVGKCTTVIERNNLEKFTTVTTKSAPDTFFYKMETTEKIEKTPVWWSKNFILPILIVLSVLFVLELLFKIINPFKK